MKNKNNIFYISPQALASCKMNTPVLLAFSGGADSSALLHILFEDAKNNGYELHAAHFNHGIRGDEAERDAEFCKRVCNSLNIPFYLGKADIPALANESGNSIEAEAREKRYAFFEKIMRENNIPILVTAHHAEDQIESILLHILRGSGIVGLRGMTDCRSLADGLFLVRPMLKTEKEDILSFCAENNIEFVTDSTNSDTGYSRNFIRAELTPKMKALQPKLSQVFERLSKSAAEADDFIEITAKKYISDKCENSIHLSSFNELHPTLKARVIALAFEKISSGFSLENTHIKSVIELSSKAEPHSSISLPGKIAARIENGCLVFTEDKEKNDSEDFTVPFTVGKVELINGVSINVEKNPKQDPLDSDIFLDVNCDIIQDDAHFRSKREGDVIFSGKMNKKIKKLINEKKIPLNMRKKLPLLVSDNKILWVPTVATCDCVKKDKPRASSDFYRITINFENNI